MPDDLILLAGTGFNADDKVVYALADGGAGTARRPSRLSLRTTPSLGIAEVVSSLDVPQSLTIRLPEILLPEHTYALWVVTARGEWSRPAYINDARPLWISPSYVFESDDVASLRRYIKVVGRNLASPPGQRTQLKLVGQTEVELNADEPRTDEDPSVTQVVREYVVTASLPRNLAAGSYRVLVRKGESAWVEVPGQQFVVRPDPMPSSMFPVTAPVYGGCSPNVEADSTSCITLAARAAASAGGGTVVLAAGMWHLRGHSASEPDGIIIPPGVNLRGAGTDKTTIVRDDDQAEQGGRGVSVSSVFTLTGRNVVQDITFRDDRHFNVGISGRAYIKLGVVLRRGTGASATNNIPVEDVVITRNVFARPYMAVGSGGERIRKLFLTHNEIGGWRMGLELAADGSFLNEGFGIEDSVIVRNVFKPGSYLEPGIRQGTIASELGAGHRVDFSDNRADGAATDGLDSEGDVHGWRAAFFWHLDDNVEMMLVARNQATCTGDKDGDGEAISYDNNKNTFALGAPATLVGATLDSVTIVGSLASTQNGQQVDPSKYYKGHWVQVVDGPGLGQVRKITFYRPGSIDGTVTIHVSPAWDAVPAAGATRVAVGREYWQVYTVGNVVDDRTPGCLKTNRTRPGGGGIGFWGQTADSSIAGNLQYDTDGIVFRQHFDAEDPLCKECDRETSYVNFLEIRDNTISGEVAWSDDCSTSGIWGSVAAGPETTTRPPTVSYGVSISHNIIDSADARQGGAITMASTWFAGPAPHRWPLVENALIFQNEILGMNSSAARPCRNDAEHPRTALSLDGSELLSRTVIYENHCPHARRPLAASGETVTRVCRTTTRPSCECAGTH